MVVEGFRFGFGVIVGKPNVGKSSLVNSLTGAKTSIISRRPQTTRNRIIGVVNRPAFQLALIDTPGIHAGKYLLNQRIDGIARATVRDADVVAMVIDARGWKKEDHLVWGVLNKLEKPIFLAINKIDLLRKSSDLLPLIDRYSTLANIAEIIPISLKTGHNVERFLNLLGSYMPLGEPGFPVGSSVVGQQETAVAELIREQVIKVSGAELPYQTAVVVTMQTEKNLIPECHADIWVETAGQKAILIGKNGIRLKNIGTRARKEIESLLGYKVVLRTRVTIRKRWSSNPLELTRLGYVD